MKFGLILLAAGEGKRFGGIKLETILNDKPVIEYILSNIPINDFEELITVAADEYILNTAKKYGISGVINDQPKLSISKSIAMGTEQVRNTDAYMYCVCDQPLLSKETIQGMIRDYKPNTILALSHNNKRGNPVIFPSYMYDELINLEFGQSGQKVINAHLDILEHYEIDDSSQLMDIDTKESLASLSDIIGEKSL
ncbi:MAG: nucleotidyltransferase family protein [Clostridiales bacterium]|nr:nucleotidyltransferase family protein [Clostridiales bacterium]